MVRRWLDRFGETATIDLLRWNNRAPESSLRIVGDRDRVMEDITTRHVAVVPSAWLDDYVRVNRMQPILRSGLLETGDIAVQDESTGLVVRLLDPQPGETIVDACAAPGGKTRYIAERLGGDGIVHAVDVSSARLQLIPDMPTVRRHAADLVAWSAAAESADRVLLDVPCTGLGVMARRADLRWRRSPDDFRELTELQDRLLDAAAAVVRPGGVLVYATCTIEPEENGDRVNAFLERNGPDFELERANEWIDPRLVTPEGHYLALPFRHDMDGAFAARMRRRS
jgi:16S rRNA (cytosine967-C5)-methyltransferase